jgi:quercetin dioxygenase-like cupin family protein
MHATTTTKMTNTIQTPVIAHAAGQGEAFWFLDNLITVKASARDGARYGLVESRLPAGSCTPMHRHGDDDESWYVLEGTMTVFLEGGQTIDAGPGSFVRVPHGVAHGFRTVTAVRVLVVTDPGGFPEFVRELGVAAPRRELPPVEAPDLARLDAVARRHHIEILGPLPV